MKKLKGTIDPIQHEETVIFVSYKDLYEYMLLTDGKHNIASQELEKGFPQIQSKHWSASLVELPDDGQILSNNKNKLGRLITFREWKKKRGIDEPNSVIVDIIARVRT